MSDRLTLVTGATGFLGATLVRQLADTGEPVRILRRTSSSLDLLGDAADTVEHAIGDVTDFASVRAALDGVTHVYHAAAFVGFGGKNDTERLMQVNVGGTANVADAARETGIERLIHVSSIAALGRTLQPQGVIDETALWSTSKANTAYAESKHLAEMEVQRAIAEGLDAVLVNPALLFGPGRPGENTMEIAEKLRDGKLPAAASGGTCVVDVADVAAGMQAAMKHGTTGERYLLGGENHSLAGWLETRGMRSSFFEKLPRARKAELLAGGGLTEDSAQQLLLSFHLTHRKDMLERFLDELGVQHENGLIEEEFDPPALDKVRSAAEALRRDFDAADVDLYLKTLTATDSITWAAVGEILPEAP